MQTGTAKVHQLFSMERRYVIPLFQRPYVWGESQWEDLWEDIREMAELSQEPGAAGRPPHFLGAIVLQGVQPSGHHIAAFQVIDGQQRLTTLQLFLSALRAAGEAVGAQSAVDIARAYIQNPHPLVDKDVERWKIWPTRKDQDQYLKAMDTAGRDALATEFPDRDPRDRRRKVKRPPMIAAWIYFYDAITAWATKSLPAGVTAHDRMLDILAALKNRLELVQIDLTEHESPQVIFETLNARGVPLLAADLLRNYIFQRAGTPAEAEQLHQTYWKRFEVDLDAQNPALGRWWDQEERQGRLTRARLDMFLQHYLSAQTARMVRIPDLFDEYKNWIKPSGGPFPSVQKELDALTRYAAHFEALVRADVDTPVGRFGGRVRAMDQSTVYPLVLWVLETPDLPSADRVAILRDLESFLVRRMISRGTSSGYNKLFLQLLSNLQQKPSAQNLHTLLAANKTDAAIWPDDATFEKDWCEIDAYQELGPGRVTMILRALEEGMHSAKNVKVTVQGALSVEHVMPQQWATHWPLPGVTDAQTETDVRAALVHDFGNLTLVTPSFNSSLSNRPANEKLPELDRHSTLLLNRAFGGGRKAWTEQDIRDRTKELFQVARTLWPGP